MKEKARNAKPIARKQGLVIQDLPDEVLVYDLDRDRAHCLNTTAAFVWQHCDGKSTVGEIAAKLAQSAEFDLAILDVNLKGKLITPVAELIRARGRPIIFATGYGSEGVPEEFRGLPALQKPFQLKTLAALIDEVLHPRAL